MKTLFLLRHGHAESKTISPDSSRHLDEEGKSEVRSTAAQMAKAGIVPELLVSSHASRAYQTAEIVAEMLGYNPKNIMIEKGIYYTDADTLEDIIAGFDDNHSSILMAGHNPAITWLAQLLDPEYQDSMPTAGLVGFELQTNSWSSFLKNKRKYFIHIYPQHPMVKTY